MSENNFFSVYTENMQICYNILIQLVQMALDILWCDNWLKGTDSQSFSGTFLSKDFLGESVISENYILVIYA